MIPDLMQSDPAWLLAAGAIAWVAFIVTVIVEAWRSDPDEGDEW